MKLSIVIIFSSLLAGAADAARRTMLRKRDNEGNEDPPSLHHDDERKLSLPAQVSNNDINSGTPIDDLCTYHPRSKIFNTLPASVKNNAEPAEAFKIEKAAGITFTFSTSMTPVNNIVISI